MEELQQSLAERDKIIANLQKRIEALENAQSHANAAPAPNMPAQTSAGGSTSPNLGPTYSLGQIATASSRQSASAEGADDAQGRALERTLVRQGGLVLPPNTFEIEPQLFYEYRSTARRHLTGGVQPQFVQQTSRATLQMNLAVRAALPWASQVEVSYPYTNIRERAEADDSAIETRRASGFGDISVAFSKQVINERTGWPGVLGSIRWNNAGSSENYENPVAVRNSFRSVDGDLTFVKTKDPLVFFGQIGYGAYFSRQIANSRIEPGNTASVRIGSIFAVRPDSSLSLAVGFDRGRQTRMDGMKVPGTNTAGGIFEVGFSYVLSPSVLLDVQTGIGLTADSPDYRLNVSLPVRF